MRIASLFIGTGMMILSGIAIVICLVLVSTTNGRVSFEESLPVAIPLAVLFFIALLLTITSTVFVMKAKNAAAYSSDGIRKIEKEKIMKNTISFLKLGIISAWLVTSLACGLQNRAASDSSNSSNSGGKQTNETVEVKPTPSATPPTFDSDKLLAYTKINQSESENLIKGKEIIVKGGVMWVDSGMGNLKFYSKLGEIWCSGTYDTRELQKLTDAYVESNYATKMPIVTAKGVYDAANVDTSKEGGKVSIYLKKCEVVTYE